MSQPCICEHSVHYHFMDFGKCSWRQQFPNGAVVCDCHTYEPLDADE